MTSFPPIFKSNPPYRILTCDGGGIYGLFTAIMLRKMCEQDPQFLAGDQVTLFAGTSAGAILSLLMAKYDNPREALLSGEAESVWKNEYTYSNKLDPMQRMLSLCLLSAWSGKADFNKMLDQYFGDLKMGDLKHRVIITVFSYSAVDETDNSLKWQPKLFCNFPDTNPDREVSVKTVAYAAASPATLRPIVNGYSDGGIFADDPAISAVTRIIDKGQRQLRLEEILRTVIIILNALFERKQALLEGLLLEDLSRSRFDKLRDDLVEIVNEQIEALQGLISSEGNGYDELEKIEKKYLATLARLVEQMPPAYHTRRKEIVEILFQTMLDEIEFTKSMHRALSSGGEVHTCKKDDEFDEYIGHLKALRQHIMKHKFYERGESLEAAVLAPFLTHRHKTYENLIPHPHSALSDVAVLSLGVGSERPAYFTPNINLGLLPFSFLPTNIQQKNFFPPLIKLLLEPNAEGADFQARQLLGARNYHRFDPSLIGFPVPPVLIACYLGRVRYWREFMAREIERMCETEKAQDALAAAQAWIAAGQWTAEDMPRVSLSYGRN